MRLELRPQYIRVTRLAQDRPEEIRTFDGGHPDREPPRLGPLDSEARGTGVVLVDEVFGTGNEVAIRVGFVGELTRGVPPFAELAPAAEAASSEIPPAAGGKLNSDKRRVE
jgi:hypothetical protein